METTELDRAYDRGRCLLDGKGHYNPNDGVGDDAETMISDVVCDLLTVAERDGFSLAEIVTKAAAHLLAARLETDEALADPGAAEQYLNDFLFPWSGDWPSAIARLGIVMSGREREPIAAPEFGC